MSRPTRGRDQLDVVDVDATSPSSQLPSASEQAEPARRPTEPADTAIQRRTALAALAEYKETGDRGIRERLILHYAPLVKYVAGRVGVGLPSSVDPADLVSNGMFGLIDAIEKYQPDRAIKFETYAVSRIRGAIIDELRSYDWVPRSVRQKARRRRTRLPGTADLRLDRTPTDDEVAEELDITVKALRQIFRQVSYVHVAALDELLSIGGDKSDRVSLGRHDRRRAGRGPGHCLRGGGDQGDPRDVAVSGPPGAREDRDLAVLLRGHDAGRDRPGARRHREPRLPVAHQGGHAVAGSVGHGRRTDRPQGRAGVALVPSRRSVHDGGPGRSGTIGGMRPQSPALVVPA